MKCGAAEGQISWTDRVRNESVLKNESMRRRMFYTQYKRKADWIGHILCGNCLLKQVIEGQIEDVC